MSEPALVLHNVNHVYGTRNALNDVAFEVYSGRVTMLLGPNGAGKTTLFSLLARLLAMQSGTITLNNSDLATAPHQILGSIGIVFQQSALDLDLSVEQNLIYFAGLHGLRRDFANESITRVLNQFELASRRNDKVRLLNGGHKRRLEIARALITKPRLLLLDEPTVGLDMPTRRELVETLHVLAKTEGIAILWATHLADEVRGDDDLVIIVGGAVIASGNCNAVLSDAKANSLTSYFDAITKKAAA